MQYVLCTIVVLWQGYNHRYVYQVSYILHCRGSAG